MRYAVPGSILFHAGLAAVGLMVFAPPPPPDMPAAESVAVDLVSTNSYSSSASSMVQSDATANLRSAGSRISASSPPEPIKPDQIVEIQPDRQQAVQAEQARDVAPEDAEPVKTTAPDTVQPPETSTAEPAEPSRAAPVLSAKQTQEASDAVAPTEVAESDSRQLVASRTQSLSEERSQPVLTVSQSSEITEGEETRLAPRPKTLSLKRPTEPTYPREHRREPERERTRQAARSSQAGNGGQSNADSRASAASSSAAVANYPGRIQASLRRALRYPSGARGASGAAHVRFVVAANGSASSIRVVKSTGNSDLDEAAIATVRRASPFPAIPAEAGRASWGFTVPLVFQR